MDPITHILLGANLGYALLGHRLGRAAAVAGGLAAFAPDADVFIRSAADPLLAIEHHRGFTHSLIFAPVGAAVVASLWLGRPHWRTWQQWRWLWLAALLGYVSHALLDAATSYGTRLLWPFSSHRAGWDVIAIIDPLFTFALLIGLITALMGRRAKPARAALVVAGAYLMFGCVQHARAGAAQRELAAARGHSIARHEVMPTLANNIVWRALYLHDGRIYSDRIRVGWFSTARAREGWSLPRVQSGQLTPRESARDTRRSFARFEWFSDGWVARSPADDTVLADIRYSLSAEAFDPIWGIRFTLPEAPVEVAWINRSRERKIEPGELWREIVGGDPRFRPVAELTRNNK